MRLLPLFSAALVAASAVGAFAQIDARLMRYPDVSATQIAFTYANDLWLVPKTGGVAQRLSTPKGEESFARFSLDGKEPDFIANYDGNHLEGAGLHPGPAARASPPVDPDTADR